jgi:phage recombination protein Bet
MQQQLEIYQPKTVALTSAPLWESKIDIVRRMYCSTLTPDEFEVFIHICRHTGLDPSMKQIYAIKRGGKLTPQTGIDGYRLIAERTGKYAPGREPSYNYTESGALISSTAYVKKMTDDGTWHEVSATAFFDEYCQRDGQGQPTQFWKKFRHVMIAKCAETLALRKAFPGDLSAIRTEEEMQQAEVYEPAAAKTDNVKPLYIEENPTVLENRTDEKKSKKEKISVTQMTEISDLLSQCTEIYKESFWSSLSTQKVTDWSDVTNELYPKIKNALHKQIEIEKKRREKIEMEKVK